MQNIPSTEERVWAVLSHLSALAFGMGTLLPIIGWSGQREKSKYATFQCLQALGYQSLGYTIWILLALVIAIIQSLTTLSTLMSAVESGAGFQRLTSLAMSGHFIVIVIVLGLYSLPPTIGAAACAMGRDFRYPILGEKLAGYIQFDVKSDNEMIGDHEDRFVAAMGHFAVIIILWGTLVPLTAWVLQSKRSLFLRFQSLQTLVYQTGVTLLFFGTIFIYLFGFGVFLGTVGINGGLELNGQGMIGLAIFGLSMLCMAGIILILPLLHILGQWAGYKVLKGDDYHYPIVGRLVEKRIRVSKRRDDIRAKENDR